MRQIRQEQRAAPFDTMRVGHLELRDHAEGVGRVERRYVDVLVMVMAMAVAGGCTPTVAAPRQPEPVRPTAPIVSEHGGREGQPAHAPEIPTIAGPSCDGVDLDVVGGCFQQAVALVQDEAPPEGRLLERAAATGRLAPVCASLPRDANGPLRTASGHALRFEREVSSWDHHEDGSAAQHIDYRISCDCCAESESFTIVHSVGGAH